MGYWCRLFGAGWSHCALLLRKMIYVLLLNWLLWYLGGTGMVGSILFAWIQGYVNFYLQCTSLTRMFVYGCIVIMIYKVVKTIFCIPRSNLDCDAKKWR